MRSNASRRSRCWPTHSLVLMMLAVALAQVACASKPRSTRMSLADLDTIVAQTQQALVASEFVRDRTPDSPPVILSVQRVENVTGDVITRSEQWALMVEVVNGVFIRSGLGRQTNIRVIVPRERLDEARRHGAVPAFDTADALPTHIMTATFRSVLRDERATRADEYYCEYTMVELESRTVVWEGRATLTRRAFGRAYN